MTDREQLLALYQACFPEDEPAFWSWIFDHLYQPENTLNIRENGRIIASLQMLPCKMQFQEQLLDAHYIYAASTLPEWQGRGLMGRLLAQAAEEGIRRAQNFSVLITQEDSLLDYYARFGYEGRFCIASMPPQAAVLGGAHSVRAAKPIDILTMNALYEQAAKGMLHGQRDDDHWRLQLELFGEGAQVLERNGQIAAYAFADERGVIEAVGPEAGLLAAHLTPGQTWRTLPQEQGRPMGSIKPLNEKSREIMEQNPCFLNLMYN